MKYFFFLSGGKDGSPGGGGGRRDGLGLEANVFWLRKRRGWWTRRQTKGKESRPPSPRCQTLEIKGGVDGALQISLRPHIPFHSCFWESWRASTATAGSRSSISAGMGRVTLQLPGEAELWGQMAGQFRNAWASQRPLFTNGSPAWIGEGAWSAPPPPPSPLSLVC